MTVDRMGRAHRAAGRPGGGRYERTGGRHDTDLHAPARTRMDDMEAADRAARVEALAAQGRAGEAEAAARDMGAFVAGEPLPYWDGVSAPYFDGTHMSTIDFMPDGISQRDFDPSCVRP